MGLTKPNNVLVLITIVHFFPHILLKFVSSWSGNLEPFGLVAILTGHKLQQNTRKIMHKCSYISGGHKNTYQKKLWL